MVAPSLFAHYAFVLALISERSREGTDPFRSPEQTQFQDRQMLAGKHFSIVAGTSLKMNFLSRRLF
jgi:hypothetical protein